MKLEIEVNVAEDAIDKSELQERLRKEAILALFDDRKVTASQAAREVGLSLIDFMQLVKRRGIPYIHYTFEDWQADLDDWAKIDALTRGSARRDRVIVVANSSPLIYLADLSDLDFLNALFGNIIIPPAVFEEVVTNGGGHAVQEAMRAVVGDWIEVRQLRDTSRRDRFIDEDSLEASDSEVISLALELQASAVLIDDRDAVVFARRLGLQVASTPLLYHAAKARGWIRSVREKLDALCAVGFRLSERDYLRISKSLGEI